MNLTLTIPTFLKPALENDIKFSIIPAGRRTGKTYNVVQWQSLKMLEKPNRTGLWVDTTQSNIDAYVERYFKQILKPIWHLCHYSAQKKVLTFPNGSYIDFGSAERPENLEGFEYNFSVLNEAGIILKRERLWYNTLLPMFKGKDTRVKVIGTPKGKNTFHKLYATDDPEYKTFHYSAYDSPFWDHAELDKLKATMPEEVWKQEYMAEFIEGAGAVFRNIGGGIREPAEDLPVTAMTIDLAKHQDFTVITLGNIEAKQAISQDRFNQIDWGFQKNRIYNTWQANGQPKVLIDSTGVGDPIFDDLKAAGMNIEGFKFTNTSKAELIQSLSVAMDNNEIFYPNYPILINELEVFGYDISPMGNIRYNAPDGLHDDAVISLALFNHLCKTNVQVKIGWL